MFASPSAPWEYASRTKSSLTKVLFQRLNKVVEITHKSTFALLSSQKTTKNSKNNLAKNFLPHIVHDIW